MNIVMLIGRLTRDPELRYLPNTGTPVATFALAVDKELSKDKKQEMESKGQATADFINIVVFGKLAESCSNVIEKRNVKNYLIVRRRRECPECKRRFTTYEFARDDRK